MADIAVIPTKLVVNGSGVLNPTGVTVGAADFGVVTHAATAGAHLPKDAVDSTKLVLRVSSATGASPAVTVLAGDNPPSNQKVLGNLVVDLAAGQTKWVVVEGSRFVQDDGSIRLDSGVADLVVAALEMPTGL